MEREYSQKYLQLNRDKRIVFDARELSFFSVRPDLSIFEPNPRLEQDLEERYPNLAFKEGLVVDGAVIIQDLDVEAVKRGQTFLSPDELREERVKKMRALSFLTQRLNLTSGITLQVVNGLGLSNTLCDSLWILDNIERDIDPKTYPLYVFPGNGARTIADYFISFDPLWLEANDSILLPCERIMVKKGRFELTINYSQFDASDRYYREKWNINPRDRKLVFIVDDVVASGQTMQAVATTVRERYPNAKIIAASWLFVTPSVKENKNSPSGIDGVDYTCTILALRGNYVSRPPIMSLSCFLRSENKYEQAKTDFMQKYINDQVEFQRLLSRIKKGSVT